MTNVEQLVEKFRQKLLIDQENEKHRTEVINPLVDKVFNDSFAIIFFDLAKEINNKLGFNAVTCHHEGKSRFVVEGQHHRIYFQKGKADQENGIIHSNIIPIYIWKGVTKHLGPVSFCINPDNNELIWDIPFDTPEGYSETLFSKLVNDEDFFM